MGRGAAICPLAEEGSEAWRRGDSERLERILIGRRQATLSFGADRAVPDRSDEPSGEADLGIGECLRELEPARRLPLLRGSLECERVGVLLLDAAAAELEALLEREQKGVLAVCEPLLARFR